MHFPAKDLLPGTIDDFIAQRIEHYGELMALEQDPITNEKYSVAIRALVKAPRLTDKLVDAYLDKKMEFASLINANSSGIIPLNIDDLLITIEEYKWLLAHVGMNL